MWLAGGIREFNCQLLLLYKLNALSSRQAPPHRRNNSWSALQMLKHQHRTSTQASSPPVKLAARSQVAGVHNEAILFWRKESEVFITHMAWLLQMWIRSVVGTALDSLLKLVKPQFLSFKTRDIRICIFTGSPADCTLDDFKYCLCVSKLEVKPHMRSPWKGEPGPEDLPVTEPQPPFHSPEFQTFTYTCFLNGFPCLHVFMYPYPNSVVIGILSCFCPFLPATGHISSNLTSNQVTPHAPDTSFIPAFALDHHFSSVIFLFTC